MKPLADTAPTRHAVIAFLALTLVAALPLAAQPEEPQPEHCGLGEPIEPIEPGIGLEDTITLGQVTEPSLLIHTLASGRYVAAPLVATDIAIEVVGLLTRTTVTQTFTNPLPYCVEGIYVFPLPEGSAVDEMKLVVGERVIEGEIREKAEARREYEEAKAEGRRASLLEQSRPDLFTLSVASLGSGETVVVTIGYDDVVHYDHGTYSLRVPLVAAPRYDGQPWPHAPAPPPPVRTPTARVPAESPPGTALAAYRPDDRSGSPDPAPRPPMPFTLTVDLQAGLALAEVDSSSHPVDFFRHSPEHWTVTVGGSERGEPSVALRDFHLDWRFFAGDEVRAVRFAGRGHSLVMVVPPDHVRPADVGPVERIFVLDTSGSMSGPSLREAKAALDAALRRLRPGDSFNVLEFNSEIRWLFSEARPATRETVPAALEWLHRRAAGGGTLLHDAMVQALADSTPDAPKLRQVVFITDGLIVNELAVTALLHAHLGRSRLFTVGIGAAPNGHLMDVLAREGRGSAVFISTPEEVEREVTNLIHRLERPALTNLRVDTADPSAAVVPARLPDLYAGEPILAVVRHDTARPGLSLAATGYDSREDGPMPVVRAEDAQLARLWGRWAIRDAMRGLALGENAESVRRKVLELALDHHLVSAYTSLVAVDRTPSLVDACVSTRVPLEIPDGMDPQLAATLGVLPATATPGPLLMLLGLVLVAVALLLARRSPPVPSAPGSWRTGR